MALETATYVSDLNSANPTATDPVSQADDHLRLLKSTLKTTFPDASAPIYGLRSATAVSASGTSIDFTSIPSWVKRVTIMFVGVSTNGTSNPLIQIGDSGGIESSGYLGAGSGASHTSVWSISNYTSGFGILSGTAIAVMHGSIVLSLVDAASNTWVANGTLTYSGSATALLTTGSKSLSATLDRVRITTVSGADTFDAGTVNVLYE